MTTPTEREVLEALWNRVFGEPPVAGDWQTGADFDQFTTMLDAGAYLDAALMLVPEGSEFVLSWSRMSVDMGGKNWRCQVGMHRASGRTRALAICAAIEAALSREG